MSMPELKQEGELTHADFKRFPVWIGVHNYDFEEPWYEESDEETFRPWTGQLPFAEKRGIALVATTFEFADGSAYSGYCQATRENWDVPPAPSKTPDGTPITYQSWSARHGRTQLSVMALLNPTIFVNDSPISFHLGVPAIRMEAVRRFYAAIRKKASDIFPVRFAAEKGLAIGITSGRLDGLFYFPLDGTPFEIDTGESLLEDRTTST